MPTESKTYGDIPLYQNPLIGRCPYLVQRGVSFNFIPHWHGEIEILYLPPTTGDTQSVVQTVICEGERYCLRERDALIIGSGMVHSLEAEREGLPLLTLEIGFPLLGEDFEWFARRRFARPLLRFSEHVPTPLLLL